MLTTGLHSSDCKMNVHIRCQKNVANNCGLNAKEMAQILKDMGTTGNKLTESMRVKKVENWIYHYIVLTSCICSESIVLVLQGRWTRRGNLFHFIYRIYSLIRGTRL